MATVRFIGTGEAFDPRLPNTSLLYEGHETILVDCGYGVPHAFWRHHTNPNLLDAVYLSHQHADHCFGLPGLVVWMRIAGRKRPLRLIGGTGSTAWIRDVLELGYRGAYDPHKCFPIEFVEISPHSVYEMEGAALSTAVSEHTIANHAIRIESGGRALCYSGDGAPSLATRALFDQASVLVHECYRASPGLDAHANAEGVLALAQDCGVQALHLVHIDSEPAARLAVEEYVQAHDAHHIVNIPTPGDLITI